MRLITFVLFVVAAFKAQGQVAPSVVSDKLSYVKFDSGTLIFSAAQEERIADLMKAYSIIDKRRSYRFIFSGICSESELRSDPSLGVKRSKVLKEFLFERYGIKRNIIRIGDDQVFPDIRKMHGVQIILQERR